MAVPPAPTQLPSETAPDTVSIPNPVILPDMEFSKSTFNAAMEAAKTEPTDTETPTTTPDFPPSKEPEPPSKPPEAPSKTPDAVETPQEKGTTDDKKVEIPAETPAAKANLPEELLTGVKPEPKLDDAIAEIDAMVLPKNAKPEQVASFAKLKDQSKRVIEEKLARINELESKTSEGASRHEIEAAQKRVEAAETKAKELESTIERIAFTESPKFKQFINDESATLTSAKQYFEGTEINPDIIEYAARVTGQKRITILREAGADAELIAAVSPYLAQFDNIQRYKSGALENWKVEAAQQSEAYQKQQEAVQQQRRKSEDEVWTQTVHELTDLIPLRKFEKNDSWNSRAEQILQKAKTVYNGDGVDLKEVAVKLIKGESYDALEEVYTTVRDELINLRKENERLKSAKPGASNGQGAPVSNDANLTPIEQSKARFNRELAAARG